MTPTDRLVGYHSGVARSHRCHPSDVFAVRTVDDAASLPALSDGFADADGDAASLGTTPGETTRPADDPRFAATSRSTDTTLPTDTEVHTDG